MTQLPDYRAIAQSLQHAQPLQIEIDAFTAFTLTVQLQLATRHPDNTGPSSDIARQVGRQLQEGLAEIDPAISEAIEHGWNPNFDVTKAEFEETLKTGQLLEKIETHNAYAIYELNQDGSRAERPLLTFDRPQDWGDRSRWHYHKCINQIEMAGVVYINHCHVWQEVERKLPQAFAACGEALFWAIRPGTPEQLCGNQYLADEDFWLNEWGAMPPVWRSPDYDDDYDPYDPVVMVDADGPVTDSQLRQICEDVARQGNDAN